MRKRFFFFFAFFLLTGCVKQNVSVPLKPKPLPSWYLNHPKSDGRYVYATGSGINKKEALLNALSNFISMFSVKITSSININKKNFGGGLYNRSAKYDVKAVIGNFEVTNYEILKVYPYKFDRVLLLLKVDTKKLFENMKAKLDERFKGYKVKFSVISKENRIKQIIDLDSFVKKLQKEKEYIYTLKVMNPNFNEKPYLDFINKVYNYALNIKSSTKVSIKCDNFSIKQDIEKYLSKHGIKVGKSELEIKVIVKRKRSNSIMNLSVYNIYVYLQKNSQTLSSNSFKIVVPANVNLSGQLYDEIKKLSLKQFFNF